MEEQPLRDVSVQPIDASGRAPKTPLPGVSTLFREAWQIFTAHLGVLISLSLLPVLLFVMLTVIGLFFLLPSVASQETATFLVMVPILMIIMALAMVFALWSQVATLLVIRYSDEHIGIGEALRRSTSKISSYLWISILTGFVVVGGFLLFIVPGIIVAVSVLFAVYILLAEDVRGMDALIRSREYVRGRWGAVVWRVFAVIAVLLACMLVLRLVTAVVGTDIVENIVGMILSLIFTPLFFAYFFRLYEHLKMTQSHIDESRLRQKTSYAVLAIVGLLAIPLFFGGLLFLTYSASMGSSRQRAQDAMRESRLMQIELGLELHRDAHGRYPATLESNEYLEDVETTDPKTNKPFQYTPTPEGDDYELCATMSDGETACVSGADDDSTGL